MLCLIAMPAHGQWNGFPFGGSASNYYEIADLHPLQQIWYAWRERGIAWTLNYDMDNYSIGRATVGYTGTTNVVITNAVGVFTNVYWVAQTNEYTLTPSLTMWPSNIYFVGQLVFDNPAVLDTFAYSGPGGTNAITTLPIFDAALMRFTYAFMQNYEHDYGRNIYNRSVNTNVANGSTFDTWFASTNDAGAHPPDFPINELGSLLYYEGYGQQMATNTGWAFYTIEKLIPAYGYTNAFYTIKPIRTSNVILGGIGATTGVWEYVTGADVLDASANSLDTYSCGTNAIVYARFADTSLAAAVTLTISGTTQEPLTLDRTIGDTETAVMGTTNQYLTKWWVNITNITASGTATTGLHYQVEYTNAIEVFSSLPDISLRLYYESFDELYSNINACVWTTDDATYPPQTSSDLGFAPDKSYNEYVWAGTSTNNWAEAKVNCAAATPTTNTTSRAMPWVSTFSPRRGTYGWYHAASTTWYAYAEACTGLPITQTLSTNYYKAVHYYSLGQTYAGFNDGLGGTGATGTNAVFDSQGDSYYQYHKYVSAETATNGACVTGTVAIGSNTFPPNWCEEPTDGVAKSKGYYLQFSPLMKWDCTNGFSYKY